MGLISVAHICDFKGSSEPSYLHDLVGFLNNEFCHNKPLSISSPSLGMVIPVQITHYIPANYASRYDIAKYDREPVSIISSKIL